MNIAATSPNTATNTTSPGVVGTDPQATQQAFLELLVAQLQNQDPLDPVDGTQFLSQLTEINSVEQLVQANQTLSSIQGDLTSNTNASASNGTATSNP